MSILHHDAYRQMTVQVQTYATASTGQFTTTTNAFGSQTRWIRVCATALATATSPGGVRIRVGEAATVTASATSTLLPLNWVEYIKVTPGQRLAAVSNDTVTGSLSITELAD